MQIFVGLFWILAFTYGPYWSVSFLLKFGMAVSTCFISTEFKLQNRSSVLITLFFLAIELAFVKKHSWNFVLFAIFLILFVLSPAWIHRIQQMKSYPKFYEIWKKVDKRMKEDPVYQRKARSYFLIFLATLVVLDLGACSFS